MTRTQKWYAKAKALYGESFMERRRKLAANWRKKNGRQYQRAYQREWMQQQCAMLTDYYMRRVYPGQDHEHIRFYLLLLRESRK